MDKHFTLLDINFTQRAIDKYVDATQICQSRKKPFANWFRTKKTKKYLEAFSDPIHKTNRHAWINPDCLENLLDWVLRYEYDIEPLNNKLQEPFKKKQEEIPPTTKGCSKCHEELSVSLFGSNKNMKDGYDRRCKTCYKVERTRDSSKHAARSIEYYNNHKKQCDNKKKEWVEKNRDKVNAANRRYYDKKKAQKQADEDNEAKKLTDTVKNMGQIILSDKNNKTYQVICRESDGYVNVTNLCKAGGKKFDSWHKMVRTKKYIEVLTNYLEKEKDGDTNSNGLSIIPDLKKSEDVNNRSARFRADLKKSEDVNNRSARFRSTKLIDIETGGSNDNRGTWVHPKVAINIAQWISPEFDVQVSTWVHQLLVLGHVNLTDKVSTTEVIDIQTSKLKHNRLVLEGKEEEAFALADTIWEKMETLERKNLLLLRDNDRLSKYLERRRRVQYDKKKVIYIVKHDEFKNCYKVGIANYLTSRMSTYNTGAPEDYKVIYYQYTMYNGTIELMIRKKFLERLYCHNKEWFQFDEGPEILIDNIKKAVDWFEG